MLYCAISLGQLFINHRVVMAFVFGLFFGLSLASLEELFPTVELTSLLHICQVVL